MAEPLSPDALVGALRREGVRVITVGSWRTHNRNHKGPWGPLHGVMVHHTVTRGTANTVRICYDGYAGLPGPLCHGVIAKDGTVHIISAGRANHAGGGDPNVLQAVIDERYNERPPVPQVGNATGIDGNAHFIGWECENMGDGIDPWPEAQVDAIIRASAAICRYYRWSEKSVIGHAEWSKDKSDPRGPGDVVSMPRLRAKIADRLTHEPSWTPTPTGPGATPMYVWRTHLARNAELYPAQDVNTAIYWDTEYTDDGTQHGTGGKTVLTNGRYSASISVHIEGLKAGETFEIYPVEENTSGTPTGSGFPHHVRGEGDGTAVIKENIPFIGHVGQRLTFYVTSHSATAKLKHAQISMSSGPN